MSAENEQRSVAWWRHTDPFKSIEEIRKIVLDYNLVVGEKAFLDILTDAVRYYIDGNGLSLLKSKSLRDKLSALEKEGLTGEKIQKLREKIDAIERDDSKDKITFKRFDFYRFRAICENESGKIVSKRLGAGSYLRISKTILELLKRETKRGLSENKNEERRQYISEALGRNPDDLDGGVVRVFCVKRDEKKAILMFRKRDGSYNPLHCFVLRKHRMRKWEYEKIKVGDQLYVQILSVLKKGSIEGENGAEDVYFVNVTRRDKDLMRYEVYYAMRNLLGRYSGEFKKAGSEINYSLMQDMFQLIKPTDVIIRNDPSDENDNYSPLVRLPYCDVAIALTMKRMMRELGAYLRFPNGIRYYVGK